MLLPRIEERVRASSGWSDTSDLTVARLLEAINHIYTIKIPGKLKWSGYQQWVYMDLAVTDTGEYDFETKILDASGGSALGARIHCIDGPIIMLIDDDNTERLNHTYDFHNFWLNWLPYVNETRAKPTHILEKDRHFWVRAKPNDTYVLQMWASVRPVALAEVTDEPLGADWGEAIIAGATALLLEEDEEQDTGGWWDLFGIRFNEIARTKPKPVGRIPARW